MTPTKPVPSTNPTARDSRRNAAPIGVFVLIALLFGVSTRLDQGTQAQPMGGTTTQIYEPFAFEKLAVSSVAVGFTSSVYAPGGGQIAARKVLCSAEGDDMRYRTDGTNPTSSTGVLVDGAASTATLTALYGSEIRLFRAIRTAATDVTLNCTFYR